MGPTLVWALMLGVVAGLRSMTAPAAVAWAAYLGWLPLGSTRLAFLGSGTSVAILSVLCIGELITDQLPSTPSRKVPVQFLGRIAVGALCGTALGMRLEAPWQASVMGAVGAIAGTLGGAWARSALAAHFRRDRPAALLEDLVALGAAAALMAAI